MNFGRSARGLLALPALAATAWAVMAGTGAATDCAIPIDSDGRIDPGRLAAALGACSGTTAQGTLAEVLDFGIDEIACSTPDTQGNRVPPGVPAHRLGSAHCACAGPDLRPARGCQGGGESGGDLETVILHPASGSGPAAPPPADVTLKPFRPDTVEIVAFQMATRDEMVPGLWRVEIRRGGRILAAQSFELTHPW